MPRIGQRVARLGLTLALALTLAACGRLGATRPTDAGGPLPQASSTPEAVAATTPEPTSEPSPGPTLDLPDLSAVDGLLNDIDGTLSAESSAGADEGSDR